MSGEEMAREVEVSMRVTVTVRDRLVTAARLLSGGAATEGRTCWPEEGT